MTWHMLLKALADHGRYDQVVKLLTDENADGRRGRSPSRARSCGSSGTPAARRLAVQPTNNESMSHGWGAWGSWT